MNYLQRRLTLLWKTKHCPTRHLRPLRLATLIIALSLTSAFAGFMSSHWEMPAIMTENKLLQARLKELEELLNGSVRMKDENTGEIATCKWEKVILIKENER